MTGAGDFDPDEDLDDGEDDETGDGMDYEAPNRLSLDIAEVTDFVNAYVYPWAVGRLDAGTALWCNNWAEHPPVLVRLMELAASREHALSDPGLAARWWVDVLDRHLDRVVALDGPFRGCRDTHDPNWVPGQKTRAYPNVEAWFEEWFALVLTRRTPADLFWCPGWQDHAEVHLQLTALWAAWEQARREPSAMLGWWDHAHRTLGVITGPAGPFAGCKLANGHGDGWRTLNGRDVTASRDRSGRLRTPSPAAAEPAPRPI
ncbi:MAG: DUF4913 domain-containing protein [Actinomycetota bacterium]|nr:DUF4913 domain-containing protein [Actinomycetota bacterium]